jgi:UDP-N-acetyl-2-amino-2-deoxyglucuronate dehydrogenase
MKSELNFAILGCGRIAPRHAEVLSGMVEGARLVAVCDQNREKAENFGNKYNLPFFTNLHEMMSKMGDQIDVINILTPTGCHAKHAIEAASYKKHIVVEKPMALTLDDAEEMVKACDLAQVKLFVVKQNRYNIPVQKLHEAIKSNRFGKIALATARVRWKRDQSYYDQDAWRGTWKWDGGVFSNQASHHVDLLTWLMGDVDSVFTYTARNFVKIETEDTGVALLRFRSGALGIIEATTAARPQDLEASINILGEYGTVEIGGFAVNQMKTWLFQDSKPEDEKILTDYNQNPPNVYGFGHSEYLRNVVHSITQGGGAMVDGLEGMKSLRLISAIYESAATGNEVSLRFQVSKSRLGRGYGRRSSDQRDDELESLYHGAGLVDY